MTVSTTVSVGSSAQTTVTVGGQTVWVDRVTEHVQPRVGQPIGGVSTSVRVGG